LTAEATQVSFVGQIGTYAKIDIRQGGWSIVDTSSGGKLTISHKIDRPMLNAVLQAGEYEVVVTKRGLTTECNQWLMQVQMTKLSSSKPIIQANPLKSIADLLKTDKT
jgi:hypothetical protein